MRSEWMIGAVAALMFLLSGAASAQTLPQYGADRHTGVTSCAGSTCHGSAAPWRNSTVLQNEYITWEQKDRHAKAYKTLLTERSQRIALASQSSEARLVTLDGSIGSKSGSRPPSPIRSPV